MFTSESREILHNAVLLSIVSYHTTLKAMIIFFPINL